MAHEKPIEEQPSSVIFSYIKSNLFRVIHSDGAIGGVTPRGNIHLAFYSERPAFPRMVSHEIVDGRLQDGNTVDGRPGIVREMDVDVVLTREIATELRDFLDKNLALLDEVRDSSEGTEGV